MPVAESEAEILKVERLRRDKVENKCAKRKRQQQKWNLFRQHDKQRWK